MPAPSHPVNLVQNLPLPVTGRDLAPRSLSVLEPAHSSFSHLPLCFLRSLLFNFRSMCAECARTCIPRAPRRDKCAFRGGSVRRCAVMCANFSREACGSQNPSLHPKSSLDAFLSSFLCDLIRVISTDFDPIRVISSKITYTRARGASGSIVNCPSSFVNQPSSNPFQPVFP
jgi:hypothetical protein